jgi:hypothetical protein
MEGSVIQKNGHTKAIFLFGRFQPPTVGHAVIIDAISEMATKENADGYVFVSSTQDKLKNPLSIEEKIYFLERMHSGKNLTFVNTTLCQCKTIFSIISKLKNAGYSQLTFVVGSDRIEEFSKMIGKYHPDIEVLSIGDERIDNDASNTISSVSGTRLRKHARNKNTESFSKFVKMGRMTNNDVTRLMNNVSSGLRGGERNSRKNTQRKQSRKRRQTCKQSKG